MQPFFSNWQVALPRAQNKASAFSLIQVLADGQLGHKHLAKFSGLLVIFIKIILIKLNN
jgi:hypothetical protein